MRALILVAVGLLGCGGSSAPSCKDAVAQAAKRGLPLDDSTSDTVIGVCERAGWSDEMRRCIADVASEQDSAACAAKYLPKANPDEANGTERKRMSAALTVLERIGALAKNAWTRSGAFPIASAPLTPGLPCCAENVGGMKACSLNPKSWDQPAWVALGFMLENGNAYVRGQQYYQFSYESTDGKSFLAKAVADLDCDRISIAYEARGRVADGNVVIDYVSPPPNTD